MTQENKAARDQAPIQSAELASIDSDEFAGRLICYAMNPTAEYDGIVRHVNAWRDKQLSGLAAVPAAQEQAQPTDISARLRRYADGDRADGEQGYAELLRTAADECERFYGGMMAWKRAAQDKDRSWNRHIDEIVAKRFAAQEQPVSVPAVGKFIIDKIERAIHDAKNPKGMHTNGPCIAHIEVTSLERLLRAHLAAAAAPAAPQAAAPAPKTHRKLVTLNHKQITDLLDAVKDDDDVEAEVTLIAHDAPFTSLDGDQMDAGLYFYWTEYPEEGIVPLFDSLPATPQGERETEQKQGE